MSNRAMSWAIEVRGLPIATKAVLMLLADCHNGSTGQCHPSLVWMIERTGLKERAIQVHLKALEDAGLINREYAFHGRGKGCSIEQYHLKIGITGSVKKAPMETQDFAPAKQCARKIRSMEPQNTAVAYKEEPEENRKIRGKEDEDAFRVLESIWRAWSPEGRKRSKAKTKIAAQLTALAKKHSLKAIESAALAFAADAKPEFHPALDRWLKDGKFENWQAGSDAPSQDLTHDEWARAMRHWTDTLEWLADYASPAPDQPGCKAPANMLRHAAKLVPDRAERILANIEQRKVA